MYRFMSRQIKIVLLTTNFWEWGCCTMVHIKIVNIYFRLSTYSELLLYWNSGSFRNPPTIIALSQKFPPLKNIESHPIVLLEFSFDSVAGISNNIVGKLSNQFLLRHPKLLSTSMKALHLTIWLRVITCTFHLPVTFLQSL